MANPKNFSVEIADRLAVITLCNPKRLNAINASMYEGIADALNSISNDSEVTITVITGSGNYYCSGTDLLDGIRSTGGIKKASQRLRNFVESLINHKKILVAIVNGPAVGIAVTTLGLCDVVYSVDTATFYTPFTKLGMVLEACSSYTFPRIMGSALANKMLLFNCKLTAKEAHDAGLISQVCTKEDIDKTIWPMLRKNAAELPLKSLEYSKELIRKFDVAKLHEANRRECERLEERWTSEDCLNAIKNFMTKRSKL